MLNDVRVYPTGSGGPFAISERRPNLPPRTSPKSRECYAYRNAIPLLFKGEERFRGLTPNETAVLCALLRRARAEFEGRCWPTHEQLAGDLHGAISVRQLTRVVGSLRDKKWIAVKTVHANQRLPSGAPVRGGERNVYAIDLARITGATTEQPREDGQNVHPRNANDEVLDVEIVGESASAIVDAVDQDLNKITDPQREAASDECTNMAMDESASEEQDMPSGSCSIEATACMLLAYWMQTAFPEYAEREGRTLNLAAGPGGHARVARVLGLLQRGFDPETLKDAILGATVDAYVREAGCPLPLVFGEKILHYARLGARERDKRRRAEAREDAARARAANPSARPEAPPPERVSPDQMLADISRLLRGGPLALRRAHEPSPAT